MSDLDAAPCSACGQFVGSEERSCSHCGGSVLVDLMVTSRLADGRERYKLARALAILGDGRVTALALQANIAAGRGRLLSSVTQSVADRGAALVRAAGLTARIEPAACEAELQVFGIERARVAP